MACQITNNSNLDISGFEDTIQQLVSFSQDRFGFEKPPALFLNSDPSNAANPLGKTAYYDPQTQEIHIYVDERHPKDIMRSISHELIHHVQNLRGDLSGNHYHGEGYAQKDKHMREMEREAYEEGNMCFRDFEDLKRENKTTYNEWRTNQMSLKEWKNKELFTLLSNKWGFGKNTITEAKEDDPNRPVGYLKRYLKSRGVSDEELDSMTEKEMDDLAAMKRSAGKEDDVAQLEEELEERKLFPRRGAEAVQKFLDRVEKQYGAEVRVKLEDAETDEEAVQIAKGVETRSPKATAMHFVRLSRDIRALQSQKKTKMNPDFMEEGLEEEKKEHPLDVVPPHTGKPDAKDFAKLRKDKKDKEAQNEAHCGQRDELEEGELELYGTGAKEEADLKGMEAISEEDDRDEELRHKDAAMDDFAHIAKLHKDMVYDTYKKYEDELLGHEKEGERYDDAERDDAAHMDYLGKDAHDDHEAREDEEEDLKESIRRHFKRLLK
tara:strand:- start:658 stop:2136 length:1479 start_codon:yes stop_codon:yes gene_type:complete